MKLLTVVLISLSVASLIRCQFEESPSVRFSAGEKEALIIKLSKHEDQLAIAYKSGLVRLFDVEGKLKSTLHGHKQQIADMEWFSQGLITADKSGMAIRWSLQGQVQHIWNLDQPIVSLSVNEGYFAYVAFNLGTIALEYSIYSGELFHEYIPPIQNQTFTHIQYTSSSKYLFAALSCSQVFYFHCFDGNEDTIYFNLTEKGIVQLQPMVSTGDDDGDNVDSVLVLTAKAEIYQVGYQLDQALLVGSVEKSLDLAICPNSLYFVALQTENPYIDVYTTNAGIFQQFLNYMKHKGVDMDCSDSFLATIDESGQVFLTKYSEFPAWIIGLIVGILCLIAILAICIGIVKKKKKIQKAKEELSQSEIVDSLISEETMQKQSQTQRVEESTIVDIDPKIDHTQH